MVTNELFKTLTAAQVNGADSADVELFTFSDVSSIARVPVAVSLFKPAGTAYVVAADARIEIKDDDGELWFSLNAETALETASATSRFQRADAGTFSTGNTTLNFSVTGSVATGDSVLGIRIWYEEYPIAW